MGPFDLKAYNFYDNKWLSFEFESGVKVEGLNITGIRNIQGKLMLIQLQDCTVTYKDEILFTPTEGIFNMVVGSKIISAYAGSADHDSFPNLYQASEVHTTKAAPTAAITKLESLYQDIRNLREAESLNNIELEEIRNTVLNEYAEEWLLILEIIELTEEPLLREQLILHLNGLSAKDQSIANLINNGLRLLS